MKFPARIALCTLLILLAATATFSQTPTSGAMLTITDSNSIVLLKIYDSQIHSGTVQAVPLLGGTPACVSGDQAFPTDAYVLQGGSATGCDATDVFEVTDLATSATTFTPRTDDNAHQLPGSRDIGGFHIETHYICAGACASPTPAPPYTAGFCNSSSTICTSADGPDSGFLIVKNTGSAFTGTITLQATSQLVGGLFCPANGTVSDSVTFYANPLEGQQGPLANGGTWTFALSTDSSNCGGFNFDQVSLPMASPTQITTFTFGDDKFIVKPSNIAIGDVLTFRPVPMPAGQFNLPGLQLTGSPQGNGTQCVSVADFAANLNGGPATGGPNPVCPELQTHCLHCPDPESFAWTGEFDSHLDQHAGYPVVDGEAEIGGVHFLGAPGVNCPQNSFSVDITASYTGDSPGDLPLHGGSGGGLNCFVASYEPAAAPIPPGVTISPLTGFFAPVVNDGPVNIVNAGRTVPLKITVTIGAGGSTPLTTLNYCNSPSSPGSCSYPWVAFLMSPLTPCNGAVADANNLVDMPPDTNSGFQNLGNGNYQFNWVTKKAWVGMCTTISTVYNGLPLTSVTNGGNAAFQFTK